MNKKLSLLSTLLAAAFVLCVSCTVEPSDKTHENNTFSISQVAQTTTSVTISWPTDSSSATNHIIRVYKDEALTTLLQTYALSGSESHANKFTVPFLNCDDIFYITVEDPKGNVSTPLTVALEGGITRRTVLVQNFDKLCWGYDYINSASGIRLNNDVESKLSSYNIESLADSFEDCHIVTKPSDEGGLLFACNASLKELLGVTGWSGTKACVYMRPGFVKLGNAYTTNCELTSPKFSTLAENEKVSVDLSFDLCMYSAEINGATGNPTVSIVNGSGTTIWSQQVFVEAVNESPKWKTYTFSIDNITSDCYFKIAIDSKTKQLCFDNLKIVRQLNIEKDHIYGYVVDKSTDEPIEGVAISDGFQVVVTDKEGFYSMKPDVNTYYIYYSIPSEYKVTIGGNGLPKFFTRYESSVREYNFSLRKLEGGAEKKFALFAFADPQVSSKTKLSRFTKEAVPFIGQYVKNLDCPCYGITLGDIISNSSGSNSELFRTQMRDAMHYNKIKLPVYQVMGNHDANYYDDVNTLEGADKNERNIKAQRAFESTNGPINYSFNRGNIHVIGMKDIVYNDATTMANYTGGFIDSQYEWLKQDLAVVPKDMTVVLCVHIPLHNYRAIGSVNHMGDVHQLLNQFKEAHILSGHTHYNVNKEPTSSLPNIYEHNVGTVCGTWWTSNLCGDGTPNGFGVFVSEGSGFSEWYYMGYNEGMNTRDYQLRLYRGNAITGAKKDDNQNGTEGYYQFNYNDDVILANVFNADSKWTIEVYEDGVKTGNMKKLSKNTPSFSSITGKGTWESPYKIKSGVKSTVDMWVAGFHMGVLDRFSKDNNDEDAEGDEEIIPGGSPSNGSWTTNDHMYSYTLKNKNAKVKVIAIDRFGKKYESNKFIDYRDNKLAQKP